MASFSFDTGNARKLARIPLYVLGRLVTALTPRGDRWVFGCGAGIADGPLALWHAARSLGIDAVWLTTSREEERDARQWGIPTLPKSSWRGFWATARARVAVVSHGFGDVNPYAVTGAFVAQLWHGIPLKRLGLDAPVMVTSSFLPDSRLVRRLLAWLYRRSAQRIGVLPAASHLVRGRLESAFGISDARIAVTGEPRVDVLSRGSAPARAARAREVLRQAAPALDTSRRILLYAPTWRDGTADPGIPSAAEWMRIIALLEKHDAVLAVRSHRLGEGEYRPPVATDRIVSLGSDVLTDVTPALPGFEALITDYSSLAYDSALVPLPAVSTARMPLWPAMTSPRHGANSSRRLTAFSGRMRSASASRTGLAPSAGRCTTFTTDETPSACSMRSEGGSGRPAHEDRDRCGDRRGDARARRRGTGRSSRERGTHRIACRCGRTDHGSR